MARKIATIGEMLTHWNKHEFEHLGRHLREANKELKEFRECPAIADNVH